MADVDEKENVQIGLIGMGDMGRMYARHLTQGGWKRINVCDRPENYERLRVELEGTGLNVLRDGHLVSRTSDFIVYSVETEYVDRVVAEYGSSTKVDAIVSGQTSVKAPERAAFEKYLPDDVHIISCHSLHGPTVSPEGQPLILIRHRAPEHKLRLVERILACLRSRYVYLSYEEHDGVTANTQAVTHAAFLSMGTAWRSESAYPWASGRYPRGIETVKVNLTLRIYSNKWHVYAGLALLNPSAREQIDQYAKSVTELYKLMVNKKEAELKERMWKAREKVFGWKEGERGESQGRKPILLSDKVLDRFSLGSLFSSPSGNPHRALPGSGSDEWGGNAKSNPAISNQAEPPNSHLSLLSIVDSWAQLGIDPYAHLSIAGTPLFRLWIGVSEYLFRSPARLEASLKAAVHDESFRSDDTEFVVAARGWAQAVEFGHFDSYRRKFQQTAEFFQGQFEEGNKVGAAMIKAIATAGDEGQNRGTQ